MLKVEERVEEGGVAADQRRVAPSPEHTHGGAGKYDLLCFCITV